MQKNMMDKKSTEILYYLGIVFWCLSFFIGSDDASLLHKNQGFILSVGTILVSILYCIPILGWISGPILHGILIIFAIIGIVNAAKGLEKELPIVGAIKIFNE